MGKDKAAFKYFRKVIVSIVSDLLKEASKN